MKNRQQTELVVHAALLIGALFFIVPAATAWDARAGTCSEQLGIEDDFADWPERHGVWLAKREQGMGGVLRARRAALARGAMEKGEETA